MSNKEIVLDLVKRLPNDASLHNIAREIEFVAGVREALAELDRGEGGALRRNDIDTPPLKESCRGTLRIPWERVSRLRR